MKKAIIFDLDGTAVDSPASKLPSLRLIRAIEARKKDFYFCTATGRPWSFAQQILHALQLEDPCIISGGTQICNPKTGKILWQADIPPQDVKAALAIFAKHNKGRIVYNDFSEEDYLQGGQSPEVTKVTYPIYIVDNAFIPEKDADIIAEELETVSGITATFVGAQRQGYKDVYVTSKKATKEHAVTELCRMLKIDKKQTIGIGDGDNDIHLFNAVGQKVAMKNAVADLKKKADVVIGAVNHDGLAEFIENL